MTRKKYMTVVEAVQYLLGKDEQIDAGTIESITYENGNLTFTFKDGSTQTINITTEPLEVENIEALTDEELENLKAGDIVLKLTDGMKHTYIVTYKEEGVGLCLSYFDYGYAETVSYDYDSDVEAWTLNDVERLNIKQELDNLKTNKQDKLTAGSGITIDPETNEISSDGVTYTAGTNINIDSDNKISCTVDTSNFVEKLVPTGTSDIYDQFRTKIEREIYMYDGHENAKGIRNKSYQRLYLQGQTKYSETYLGTEDGNDYEFKELIFNKSGTPSYSDETDVAYKILNEYSLTESINNKYKKVYNTSSDSYSETFKYSQTVEGTEMVYNVVREPFKFIASDITLSADVDVLAGLYEVITVTGTANNTLVLKDTIYKSLMYNDANQYECLEIIPANSKQIVKTYNFGRNIQIYTYDTSTTPETLIDNMIRNMPQVQDIVEHNIVITGSLPTIVDNIPQMNIGECLMFRILSSDSDTYSSVSRIAEVLYIKGHTSIDKCIIATGRHDDDDFTFMKDDGESTGCADIAPIGVYATRTESGGVYTYHLYIVLRHLDEDASPSIYAVEYISYQDYIIDTKHILISTGI